VVFIVSARVVYLHVAALLTAFDFPTLSMCSYFAQCRLINLVMHSLYPGIEPSEMNMNLYGELFFF
jgi:hypothetical protein